MVEKLTVSVAACTLLIIGGTAGAQTAARTPLTVPFSDPGRPGTVRVSLMRGNVSVKAGTGRDVIITTEDAHDDRTDRNRNRDRDHDRDRDNQDQAAAGLHRLTPPSGVTVTEEANTVTVSTMRLSDPSDISIQVPASTSLVIQSVAGAEVTVQGIDGSIEVNSVNGAIQLTDVGGPVIAHATNGRIVATLRQMPTGKPMAFTSFNGNVDVTLPAAAKASLKLRSDRGDVYTDFDVQPAPAAASPTSAPPRNRTRDDRDDKDKGKYRLDLDRSIYGTINGGGADVELRTFNGNIYLRKAH